MRKKPKERDRPKRKISDPEKYKKQQRKKKKKKKKKKDRAISRERRNFVRRQIKPYYEAFRNYTNKIVLIILKETDNMEKILFKKDSFGKGITFLSLPIISEEEIKSYCNSGKDLELSKDSNLVSDREYAIKALVEYMFSISAEIVIDSEKIIILKGCKVLEQKNGYIALNVRPYNPFTWYHGHTATIYGCKVYKGNILKTFFDINGDIYKTYISHDSLTVILLYRSMVE